ncbi:MAG: ATP phosphoribosyltransferase regulatory subunit [Clostridia bacterium]
MEITSSNFNKEELVTQNLRHLFSNYGYSRYTMGKFEPYDIYLANKAFLDDEKIITFTDGTGKLMALKPDVTISIIKNLPATQKSLKVYYSENVFRMRAPNSEYHEIAQMGVEYIGANSCYSEAEIVYLASLSLKTINEDYLLNVSHMGFLSVILENKDLTREQQNEMIEALKAKNSHTLKTLLEKSSLSDEISNSILAMASLNGYYLETLEKAKQICVTAQMEKAYDELLTLYKALENTEVKNYLRLDFSIINDNDYYNGIVLKGFVRGVPKPVLAGGRYDKLMTRFNKPQCALGFALYLGELSRMFAQKNEFDVDSLLLYNENQDVAFVMSAVRILCENGSVRAETFIPNAYTAKNIYSLQDDGTFKEVKPC